MGKGFNMGGGGMGNIMKQAQMMQKQMAKMQEDISKAEFTESVGGGAVTVVVDGKKNLKSLKIDKDAFDPEDIGELEDMLISAINNALAKAEEASSSQLGELTGGLNIPGMF